MKRIDEKCSNFIVYATYTIIYANDTACNSVLELEEFINDEDKETKKIYRALKRRALGYLRFFNSMMGELSWATSDYFGSMDEKTEGYVEDIYKEIENVLIECGAEKTKLYAKLEQVRLFCHIAVEIHSRLIKECKNNSIPTYSLASYRLDELKRVADNLSNWLDRRFKSKKQCDMTKSEKLVALFNDLINSLMSFDNFIDSYEFSCNVNER